MIFDLIMMMKWRFNEVKIWRLIFYKNFYRKKKENTIADQPEYSEHGRTIYNVLEEGENWEKIEA